MKKKISVITSLVLLSAMNASGQESNSGLAAVSGLNGKASVFGGNLDGDRLGTGQASITTGIGHRFGFQADALVSKVDNDDVRGLAAHFFWRNPETAMVGLVASALEVDDIRVERLGVEGEYFTNSFTVAGAVGNQGGDVESDVFGRAEVTYYATDNMAISLAGTKVDDDNRASLDFEYQTSLSGLALFASAENGNDSYSAAHAGVRFYFGKDKNLKRRHREDDPKNPLLPMLSSSISAINEVQVQRKVEEVVGLLDGLGALGDVLGGLGLDGLTDALGGLGLDGLTDLAGLLGGGASLEDLGGLEGLGNLPGLGGLAGLGNR